MESSCKVTEKSPGSWVTTPTKTDGRKSVSVYNSSCSRTQICHASTFSLVNEGPEWEWGTPPLVRLKMLLSSRPFQPRKGALMLDGPPRGRSPVAFRRRKHNNNNPAANGATVLKCQSRNRDRNRNRSRTRSRSRHRPVGLTSYPPYMAIPEIFSEETHNVKSTKTRSKTRVELVRGSTCQLIMQLMAEHRSIRDLVDQLPFECDSDDATKMLFEIKDIEAVVRRCREHGLTAQTPLQVDAEDWEGEEIEKWWDNAMEEWWRDDPIDRIDTGSWGVAEGWWTTLESRENRDWRRWRSVRVGPRNTRKALRMDEEF